MDEQLDAFHKYNAHDSPEKLINIVRYCLILKVAVLLMIAGTTQLPAQDKLSERELSLMTPLVSINPDETQYSETRRIFQGIPGIERASNGRLWVSRFSGGGGEGGPANHAMLITSGNDGRTWSGLKVVVDMPDKPVRLYDPCVWIDPLGRLWFFWAQAYSPHVHCGVWAIVTENPEDADPVWSAPRRLCEGIMLNKPTVLSNGDWLLPTTIWKIDNSCRVVASEDQGKTFALRGTANIPDSSHRCPDEPMIVQRNDGSLWMLVRTNYGMGESVSKDGGRAWSPVSRASIKHATARFHIRRLQSGHLLLIKHGPVYERIHRERLTAYISKDDGESWEGGLLLDERHPVSYPDAVQAPDGSIYAVYDHGRYAGTEREIMMAVFAEDNVLAGKPSKKTRLKVVINRALEPLCDQKNY
jgi:hypothetical protein